MSAAEVKLWGKTIGAVYVDDRSPYAYFRYEDSFIKSGIQVSPIRMPLSREIYQFNTLPLESFHGLPGLLSDSLPDRYGNQIIQAWLKAQGRPLDSLNSVERLCYVGQRGMGALEYHPAQSFGSDTISNIELNQLVDVSNAIIHAKKDVKVNIKDDLKTIIKVGTSAGGARAKAITAYNEKTGAIQSGQIDTGPDFTHWLIKLDGIDQADNASFTRREYAYYLMAKTAGIQMNESRLLKKDGFYHFMTKRFDRVTHEDGRTEKKHMQTLGALTHTDYNEPGLMSYEQVTNIMYQMGLKLSENKEFFRQLVFNVMARNLDDHVKNISFLMDKKGIWTLAPAYDVTYAYNPLGRWTSQHQMRIQGKTEHITYEDLTEAAKSMNLKVSDAKSIIQEVQKALHHWEKFASDAELKDEEIATIKSQFILFE